MSETIKNEKSGVEVETVSSASTTDNAKKLDTLIAVYNKGAFIMKVGMAIKLATLAIIDKTKLYTVKNYKNVTDFAENELHLGKKTAQLYLQTVKKFYDVDKIAENNNVIDLIDNNGEFKNIENFQMVSVLADNEGNDFSPATLTRIRALSVDLLKELINKNVLTYDMTDREIKEIVKPYRKNAKENDDNESENYNSENDNVSNESSTSTTITLNEIEELKKQIAALQAENNSLKEENKNLKEENKNLKDSNNSYKAANSKKKNDIKNLQTENDKLTKNNKELVTENETLKTALDTITSGNSEIETINNSDSDSVTIQAE